MKMLSYPMMMFWHVSRSSGLSIKMFYLQYMILMIISGWVRQFLLWWQILQNSDNSITIVCRVGYCKEKSYCDILQYSLDIVIYCYTLWRFIAVSNMMQKLWKTILFSEDHVVLLNVRYHLYYNWKLNFKEKF